MNTSSGKFRITKQSIAILVSVLALIIALSPYISRFSAIYSSRAFDRPINVQLVQLLSTPERFDGALVTLFGWCVVRFEDMAIQLSSDAAEWYSSVWLDLDDNLYGSFSNAENDRMPRFCRVEGIFQAGVAGHMGRSQSQISPVEDLMIYKNNSGQPQN